jgi:hypothetical protein
VKLEDKDNAIGNHDIMNLKDLDVENALSILENATFEV